MSTEEQNLEGYENLYVAQEDRNSQVHRSSAGSLYSAQDDMELKKKCMQGFDEMKDSDHMVCKRLRHHLI
jgi:hypothetical protein